MPTLLFAPPMLPASAHLVPTTTLPSILPFGKMRAPIDMRLPSTTTAMGSSIPETTAVVPTQIVPPEIGEIEIVATTEIASPEAMGTKIEEVISSVDIPEESQIAEVVQDTVGPDVVDLVPRENAIEMHQESAVINILEAKESRSLEPQVKLEVIGTKVVVIVDSTLLTNAKGRGCSGDGPC